MITTVVASLLVLGTILRADKDEFSAGVVLASLILLVITALEWVIRWEIK